MQSCVEKDPAAYYKAQGLNEVYEEGIFNLENIRPQYLTKTVKMRINELFNTIAGK